MASSPEAFDILIDQAVLAMRAQKPSAEPPADIVDRVRQMGTLTALQSVGSPQPVLVHQHEAPILRIGSEAQHFSASEPELIEEPRRLVRERLHEIERTTPSAASQVKSSKGFFQRCADSLIAFVISRWLIVGPALHKAFVVGIVLSAGILWTFLVPKEFYLYCKGTLEPKTKASLFAALDGNVVKLYVKSGDEVQKDQPVLEMRSTELGVQFEELNGKMAANLANIRRLEKDIVDDRLSPFEQTRNARELDADRALQEGYQKELQLLEEKRKKLIIRSPIKGKVITFQLDQLLGNRPVQRGDRLMEVIDPSQEWELQVRILEDRMGHIKKAQHEIKPELDVEYIMNADPGHTLIGTVREIQEKTEIQGAVLVRVNINKGDLGIEPQKGAGVSAKIDCGKRSLGYIWFRPIIEFVRSKILF
jgi:Barrel-sandwich domain of CusB or HlyD membrane-fusion